MSGMLRAALFAPLLSLLMQAPASAEPMDLDDLRPRWVAVRFEVSPADRPGQLDTVYTPEFPAWLTADDVEGRARVTIDGRIIEQYLLEDHRPVEGSFSDYIWVFDTSSGHVVFATVAGKLIRTLDWGWFTSEVEASIRVQMATRSETGAAMAVGFSAPRSLLGQLLFRFCTAGDGGRCMLVPAAPYDRQSGYVNAVGSIRARCLVVTSHIFSPLGEARFSETHSATALSASPPTAEAGGARAALRKRGEATPSRN